MIHRESCLTRISRPSSHYTAFIPSANHKRAATISGMRFTCAPTTCLRYVGDSVSMFSGEVADPEDVDILRAASSSSLCS